MPDRTLSTFIPSFTRNCEGLEIAASSSRRAGVSPGGVTLAHAEHTPTHYSDRIRADDPGLTARSFRCGPTSWANRRATVDFAVGQRMPGMYPGDNSSRPSYGVSAP